MDKTKILDNIIQNTDDFSWKELNCFYRPFAISLNSFNKCYHDLFLLISSLYQGFIFHNTKLDSTHPMIQVFNSTLSKSFGITIGKEYFNNKNEFIEKIANSIDASKSVIVPADTFNLEYDNCYLTKHFSHFFLVKGYDFDKKYFYILDNIHIDQGASTLYTDFVISFKSLFSLNHDFTKIYESTDDRFFWTIFKNNSYNNDINSIIETLEELLRKISKNISKHFWELTLINNLNYNKFSKDNLHRIYYNMNQRIVFYKLIIKILNSISNQAVYVEQLNSLSTELINETLKIKNLIIYTIYDTSKDYTQVSNLLSTYIDKNSYFFNEILKCMSLNKSLVTKSIENYVIKNNNNGIISCTNNIITIKHSKTKIYDTWLLKNNACQVLWKVNNSDSWDIFSNIKVSAGIGDPFHCGIIIIFQDDNKLLYGNKSNEMLSLYEPTYIENNYIKFETKTASNQNLYIKVSYENSRIKFYAKSEDLINWNLVYHYVENRNIKMIGFFSKTWEYIDNEVKFKNYTVDIY